MIAAVACPDSYIAVVGRRFEPSVGTRNPPRELCVPVAEAKDDDPGGISYQLGRAVNDAQNDVEGESQPRHNCRYDLTTLDAASMDITAQTVVFASIRPDKQGAYILIECQYRYANVLTDSDA